MLVHFFLVSRLFFVFRSTKPCRSVAGICNWNDIVTDIALWKTFDKNPGFERELILRFLYVILLTRWWSQFLPRNVVWLEKWSQECSTSDNRLKKKNLRHFTWFVLSGNIHLYQFVWQISMIKTRFYSMYNECTITRSKQCLHSKYRYIPRAEDTYWNTSRTFQRSTWRS